MLTAAYDAEVRYRGGTYRPTPGTQAAIAKAAAALSAHSSPTRRKCGIMLLGLPGGGKTTLVYAIQSLIGYLADRHALLGPNDEKASLAFITALDIARASHERKEFDRIATQPLLAIDDLGLEPTETLDYGNVRNPIIEIITRRYDRQLYTILTSNISPEGVREKYGDRIADRFNEMMTKIVFDTTQETTFRKQ